jgi:hypothetical protein
MNPHHPAPYADHSRSLLAAAARHQAQADAVSALADDVHYGLRQFTDSFLGALGGDFLADADERRLRERHRQQPATLQRLLARNQRCLRAQRALHGLYDKLCTGAAMSIEERALAEHARDLCEGYAEGEIERRSQAL